MFNFFELLKNLITFYLLFTKNGMWFNQASESRRARGAGSFTKRFANFEKQKITAFATNVPRIRDKADKVNFWKFCKKTI